MFIRRDYSLKYEDNFNSTTSSIYQSIRREYDNVHNLLNERIGNQKRKLAELSFEPNTANMFEEDLRRLEKSTEEMLESIKKAFQMRSKHEMRHVRPKY